MPAEATTARLAARDRTAVPSIVRPAPTVTSVTGASDDIGCAAERLESLVQGVIQEMNDIVSADGFPRRLHERFYAAWMLLLIGAEKLTELRGDIDALIDAVYAQSKELAA